MRELAARPRSSAAVDQSGSCRLTLPARRAVPGKESENPDTGKREREREENLGYHSLPALLLRRRGQLISEENESYAAL
jgi:hypothetical protein